MSSTAKRQKTKKRTAEEVGLSNAVAKPTEAKVSSSSSSSKGRDDAYFLARKRRAETFQKMINLTKEAKALEEKAEAVHSKVGRLRGKLAEHDQSAWEMLEEEEERLEDHLEPLRRKFRNSKNVMKSLYAYKYGMMMVDLNFCGCIEDEAVCPFCQYSPGNWASEGDDVNSFFLLLQGPEEDDDDKFVTPLGKRVGPDCGLTPEERMAVEDAVLRNNPAALLMC